MARGRGRFTTDIPVTPRLQRESPEAPQAPKARGTNKLILRADGTYEEPYRAPTPEERDARVAQQLVEGDKNIKAFLSKARR